MLIEAGLVFAASALFPRLAYWLRWPTRLRGWALLAYIAWNTAVLFWLRQWLLPALREAFAAAAAEHAAARAELRTELGREPTDDEVVQRVAKRLDPEALPLLRDRGPRS